MASAAHYPAESVPGTHRTELLCALCNSFIGHAYEDQAADFLNQTYTVSAGPADVGKVTGKTKVRRDGASLRLEMTSGRSGGRGPSALGRTLDGLRARSDAPHELDFSLSLPGDEYARRALLAWSFLEWFYYAGYRYVASAGAALVRRLLLDPNLPLPRGAFFQRGAAVLPLPAPQAIVVIRAEKVEILDDIQELIGLGVEWGRSVSVLPFANDDTGRGWQRIEELMSIDQLRTVRDWPLRSMLTTPLIERGLHDEIVFERDGVRHVVSESPNPRDLAALAAGRSPRIIVPGAAIPLRVAAPSFEREFTVVASPAFGGPPVWWRWLGCRLDAFDHDRARAALARGREPVV